MGTPCSTSSLPYGRLLLWYRIQLLQKTKLRTESIFVLHRKKHHNIIQAVPRVSVFCYTCRHGRPGQTVRLRDDARCLFVTDQAFEEYTKALEEAGKSVSEVAGPNLKMHGTVGAVAVDNKGNVAAATSTCGIENKMHDRIGDSSVIGGGCYAANSTCAVSTTGDGELIVQHVVAFHLCCVMEYKGLTLQEAGEYVLKQMLKHGKGDVGILAIDKGGYISMEYHAERMHRGYKNSNETFVATYRK